MNRTNHHSGRRGELNRELYPFESRYLDLGGLKYHYLDEGKGEAIVLVHGNPTWSFYYRDLVKALRPDYRIIAVDHIGMGLSDKPDDRRYPYTSERRLKDLSILIDHLGLKHFTILGHDWGGMISTAYAAFNPEKIDAMIMFNTAGFIWPVNKKLPLALFMARIPFLSALWIRGLNGFALGAVYIGMKRKRMPKEVARGLLFPYGSWKDRIAIHRFIQDIPVRPRDPGYQLGLLMESRFKLLRGVPKLFCWGLKDFIFDEKMLNEFVRHFPDAEVHRFSDAGHYVVEDAAEDIIPIVEKFIKTKVYLPGRPVAVRETAAVQKKQSGFVDLMEQLQDIVSGKPDQTVVARMLGLKLNGKGKYETLTYAEVDRQSNRIAHGLEKIGIQKGMHTAFLVMPGTEFFAILHAILKVGAIPVLVDPGMGVRNLKKCFEEAGPEAFIGIPRAHVARILLGWGRKTIRVKVTAGKRYGWGGYTINKIKDLGSVESYIFIEKPKPEDTVMLAFTSGNTGLPKGVVYTHGTLATQLGLIKDLIEPAEGDADLATFPPFALFGPACGITAVIPDMDPTRPAAADPKKIVAAINDYQCTSMFCSPALIETIGRYCIKRGLRLPSLKKVISAGAPARLSSIERFVKLLNPGVQILTPYGATEALPVTLIDSDTLIHETKAMTEKGAGVCCGSPVRDVEVAIIKITEDPIDTWSDKLKLPKFSIGEITVKGPMVTTEYYKRPLQTRLAKIPDPCDGRIWHRMGDVGYLDDLGRLWMCGRKGHRVEIDDKVLFPLPCEAIFNQNPKVYRSALVGVTLNGRTVPVIIIQPEKKSRLGPSAKKELVKELLTMAAGYEHTRGIERVLFHKGFPVDIRHNAKISREKLAQWAQEELS